MCLLLDANVAARLCAGAPELVPILEWLEGEGRLVHGGKLTEELQRVGPMARYLLELKRAGRAVQVATAQLEPEESWVHASGLCRSNDQHIVALGRASGARVLASEDADLIADFKNRALIDRPAGKIYKDSRHRRLLVHTSRCSYRVRRRRA